MADNERASATLRRLGARCDLGIGGRPAGAFPEPGAFWPFLLAYSLLAAVWTWLVWGPAPQMIPLGDGGNVASMAAGWLDRARFAQDPVLATPDASRIYMALTVPATMLLGRALGDIGSGYILQLAPLLLAQLAGFHLLGLRLYGRPVFAAALALLSIPPVFVFPGELWGMLETPLTRGFAGAALPWVMLLLLPRASGRRFSPALVMAACGATVYLHPVSAPAIAAGCWLAMLVDRPPATRWSSHLGRLVLAALAFALIALPFGLVFANAFPGATPADDAVRAQIAALLHAATGPIYYDVTLVTEALLNGQWEWRWYVWWSAVAALVIVPVADSRARRSMGIVAAFLVGILASSIGLTGLDQAVAAAIGRNPVQLDLVRNVRFVVPILLLLAVWLAATLLAGRSPGAARRGLAAILVLGFTGYWWHFHPTPVSVTLARTFGLPVAPPMAYVPPERDEADSRILMRIRELPPHSRILPVAASRHRLTELIGLATRYAAFQPVAFLEKDINLLSYSGSPVALEWSKTMVDFDALRDASPAQAQAIFNRILERTRPDYLVVHETAASPALRDVLPHVGPPVAVEGQWTLVAASAAARSHALPR